MNLERSFSIIQAEAFGCSTIQPSDGNNICCLYNTRLQGAKLTSQVLYNETSHCGLRRESGCPHFIRQGGSKESETVSSHIHHGSEFRHFRFSAHSLKKNSNSFHDNKYLFAIKALIGIHSYDRMGWILSQLPSLQSK